MKILEGKEYRIQPNLLVSTSVAGYIVKKKQKWIIKI